MKITKIKIEDFGCLSEREFDFSGGINLITGENESGKSTLLSFIKFAFYGLPRKSAENFAERRRAISLKTNICAGELTLETRGETYKIYRRGVLRATEKRESYSEECTVTDMSTGMQVHKGECPGEVFLGVTAAVFESTCFVSQLGASEISSGEISHALENMLLSADENQNLQRTLDKLDSARKLYRHKTGRGGSLAVLEDREGDLSERLTRAMSDYERIIKKSSDAEEAGRLAMEKRAELDRVEAMIAAAQSASLVKRFDALRAKKDELCEAEREKESYINSVKKNGFLPDTAYISELSDAIRTENAAQRSLGEAKTFEAKARAERDAASNEKFDNIPSVSERVKALTAQKAKLKRKSTLLTVLAAIICVASAALGLINAWLFLSPIAAALLFIPPVLTSKKAKGAQNDIENALSSYKTNDIDTVYRRYTEDLARLDYDIVLAENAAKARESELESAQNATQSILSKWGEHDAEKALESAQKTVAVLDGHERNIALLSHVVSAAEAELSAYSEKDLRARVPEKLLHSFSQEGLVELERQKKFLNESLRVCSEKRRDAEMEAIALENRTENPNRISRELEDVRAELEKQSLFFDALVLAHEALTFAGSDVRSGTTPVIKQKAEEYMSAMTDEKYRTLGVGEDFSLTAETAFGQRELAILSAGTRDAAYLSLRLSLLSLLFPEELPALAVDEALSQLDDKRALNALGILEKYCRNGGQCLLFTCHTREERMLSGANVVRM